MCCVSNNEIFDKCMSKSINILRPHLDVYILPIYNSNNIYTASMAGNIGLDVAKTRYVMYVHQDIEFMPGSGKQIADMIMSMDDYRIITGAAGISLNYDNSSIEEWGFCRENNRVGIIYDENGLAGDGGTRTLGVHSLDEICLIIDKYSGIRFDTIINGYHLYGLDICLQARSAGYEVAGGLINLRHHGKYSSSIYRDHNFINKLLIIYNKWKTQFPSVFAPYAHWSNDRIVCYLPYIIKNAGSKLNISRISVSFNV